MLHLFSLLSHVSSKQILVSVPVVFHPVTVNMPENLWNKKEQRFIWAPAVERRDCFSPFAPFSPPEFNTDMVLIGMIAIQHTTLSSFEFRGGHIIKWLWGSGWLMPPPPAVCCQLVFGSSPVPIKQRLKVASCSPRTRVTHYPNVLPPPRLIKHHLHSVPYWRCLFEFEPTTQGDHLPLRRLHCFSKSANNQLCNGKW